MVTRSHRRALAVLVIDDDSRARGLVATMVRAAGHAVHTAANAGDTLHILGETAIDVAILDVRLPDACASDVVHKITELSPRTEVVVLTADAATKAAMCAVHRDAFAYITRPFDANELLFTVEKAGERQALEAALRESEARYRLVTENVLDALYLLDENGNITFVNRRAEALSGYPPEEALGRPISEFLSPTSARQTDERMEAARSGRALSASFEHELIRKDGRRVWVEGHTVCLFEDGKFAGRLGAARDITQRKQAETALRESEERFRATFEQAAVGIAVVADDGRFLSVNQRVCDMVGYSAEELTAMRFLDITHPDDRDANVALRRPMLEGAAPAYSMEKRYVRKDGAIIWVAITASQARDPLGARNYSTAIVQDITHRKQLEQEVLHAQRMESVGQLAGGIAHDFNNLLTVITNRTELVIEQLDPVDPLRRDLELVQTVADRAATLTRQLLAFGRKQASQPKVMPLNEIVRASTNLLERLLGEQIELAFVPAADAGRVRVDPGQLEQAIINLALNARDAMPNGGRLTIEAANVDLDDAYAARHVDVMPGRYVVLAVSDTGTGMSPAVQARIFEPFFTTKEQDRGTGLGLAMVYGIVKQSGGHVRVYSELGVGTTFRIYLPRTSEASETTLPPAATALPRGTETILLVEDEAQVRRLTRELLERLGYAVFEAATAQAATLVGEYHPGLIHLLLTDVVMPRMSGGALAEAIAAKRPEMKILFMSGYPGEAVVRHGVLESGRSFIEKPFSPLTLATKVRAVLDHRDACVGVG